jgi:hypothetical protein
MHRHPRPSSCRGLRIAAAALLLAATGCVVQVSDPPSTRSLPLGDARRYTDGQHRYRIDLELRKAGQAPAPVEGATTSLTLDLVESVRTSEGRFVQVTLTVETATARGHDADAERDAAIGRFVAITPKDTLWEIEFGGGALGVEGQVRASDLALLAHLMAPTEAEHPPEVGGAMPEQASIDTGWSSRRLAIRGSSVLTGYERVEGREVKTYRGALAAEAPVSVEVRAAPAESLVYSYPLGCLFILVDFCQVPPEYRYAIRQPTVDMTGPMTITQEATIHRSSGRLLLLTGQGSTQIGGTMPPAFPRWDEALSEEVQLISAGPVGLDLQWTFSERLTDPWPEVPLPEGLVVGASLCLIAVALLHVLALMAYAGVWPFPGRRSLA